MGTRIKKRGFVMTGGGAKGLYEAGVIHAFHITGMEFDVITGSSIGAMNSIFFAEYLHCKKSLPPEVQADPLQSLESMDGLVKAYHHAWLLMPDKRVIDDSAEGPVGQLKDDLQHFNISLPQLTRLGWWWTDPHRKGIPWRIKLALGWLGFQVIRRLGGLKKVRALYREHRSRLVREGLRIYLERFNLNRSLIPENDDMRLSDVFTGQVSPLREEHLDGDINAPDPTGTPLYQLIPPERTLRDYARQGIDVRLTRANYRTGRLEISAYVPVEDFVRFLEKQAWRIDVTGPDKLPLGSFRIQVPGNPGAVSAALCSGRFPGVFRPYPLERIYPQDDPENRLLYHMLKDWLGHPQAEAEIKPVYQALFPNATEDGGHWAYWRDSQSMRQFFPIAGDAYVDGGAIDNTPSNSAVDYVREWAHRSNLSKREVTMDLYVIFLGTEPKVDPDDAQDPTIFEVVQRTLAIQGAAKESTDANTVSVINTFGARAERLGRSLEVLLESYRQTLSGLDEQTRRQVEASLREKAQAAGLRGYLGRSPTGILDRMSNWTATSIAKDLPLHVDEVKVYPGEMPLDTLQFTERFGYRQENALQMLTMGCYNTLWAVRKRLEEQKPSDLDEQDLRSLELARKWTGEDPWSPEAEEQETLRQVWLCQRRACVFHASHCRHGAMRGNQTR
jgi:predicted acylesterase/phospholipase RssA